MKILRPKYEDCLATKLLRDTNGICFMMKFILLGATHFPAIYFFDSYLEIITEHVQKNEDDDILEDLAEMLLTWGINNSEASIHRS